MLALAYYFLDLNVTNSPLELISWVSILSNWMKYSLSNMNDHSWLSFKGKKKNVHEPISYLYSNHDFSFLFFYNWKFICADPLQKKTSRFLDWLNHLDETCVESSCIIHRCMIELPGALIYLTLNAAFHFLMKEGQWPVIHVAWDQVAFKTWNDWSKGDSNIHHCKFKVLLLLGWIFEWSFLILLTMKLPWIMLTTEYANKYARKMRIIKRKITSSFLFI